MASPATPLPMLGWSGLGREETLSSQRRQIALLRHRKTEIAGTSHSIAPIARCTQPNHVRERFMDLSDTTRHTGRVPALASSGRVITSATIL